MKNKWQDDATGKTFPGAAKILLKMKLTLCVILISFLGAMASESYSQTTKLSLDLKNAKVKDALGAIENQSEFFFLYSEKLINVNREVDIEVRASTIEKILDKIFEGTDVSYTVKGRQIVLATPEANNSVENSLVNQLQKSISGKVTDSSGASLPGVSVVVKGTTMGIITDSDGKYTLTKVAENTILQFSFVGMKVQEVKVGNQASINIVLVEEAIGLEEIVAVGYGFQKKKTLTGSISSLKGSDLLTTKSPNLIQSIQGKISGVQIRQSSSIPGGNTTSINIRGFGTPLIVIDGVLRDGVSEFEHLDPNDIEEISVLKDGSAAIYGIGASNGVLIITTKRGGKGPMKVSFSSNIGLSSPTNLPKAVSASGWIDLKNELRTNVWGGMAYSQDEIQKYKDGILPGYENVNWYNEVMKKSSIQQQHNFSLAGGTDVATYFVSFGINKDDGLVKRDPLNYKQLNFRANTEIKLSKSLKMEINLSGQRGINNQIASGGFLKILAGIMAAAPFQKPYINDDLNFPAQIASGTNPSAMTRTDLTGYNSTKTNLVRSQIALTYDLPWVKGLQAKVFGAYDFNLNDNSTLQRQIKLYKLDPVTGEPVMASTFANDNISGYNLNSERQNFQGQLSYKANIATNQNISAMVLFEQRKNDYSSLSAKRYYDFYTTDVIDQGSLVNQETKGNVSEATNASLVGRFNYDYKQKYLVEFVFRNDGSYRYNPDHRWGFFPGVSLGWRVSEEEIVKKNLSFIKNLKLRASYGETGEDAGNPFQYAEGYQTGSLTGYEFVDGTYTSAILSPSLVNLDLTWYHSKTYDAGFDLDLFKDGILSLVFDVYRRDRIGLLATRYLSLPNTFGASLPQENLNSDRVQGFDFSINHRSKIGEFNYAIGLNMNISQSMNLYLEQGQFQSSYSNWKNNNAYRNKNVVWGYDIIGTFQSWDQIRNYPVYMDGSSGNIAQLPGDPIYRDVNGDGMITPDDQLQLFRGGQITNGNSADYNSGQPPLQYGINLSGGWKNWDFNALIQGAALYTINLGTEWQTPLYSDRSAPEYLLDRWHLSDPENKDSEWIPGFFPASRNPLDAPSLRLTNDIYRRNASYVRLKNIEVGYTIPKKVLSKVNIDRFRIYVNATNLYTSTDKILKMFDPERGEGDYGGNYAYPIVKTINFGLNVTF